MCLLLVGAIVYSVVTESPAPQIPNMANAGASAGGDPGGATLPAGPAPDISQMSPRERFDRLYNRIMQAAEQGDTAQVQRFTPMALGAYAQLDSFDADARYHAAVIRLQSGDLAGAHALADTILEQFPDNLLGYVVRGTAAGLAGDPGARAQADREFLRRFDREMAAGRRGISGPCTGDRRVQESGGTAERRNGGRERGAVGVIPRSARRTKARAHTDPPFRRSAVPPQGPHAPHDPRRPQPRLRRRVHVLRARRRTSSTPAISATRTSWRTSSR